MPVIMKEDVVAFWVDDEIVCPECYDEDKEDFTDYVDRNEYEKDENYYKCDRCDKQIRCD